jgi:hypothetical protein
MPPFIEISFVALQGTVAVKIIGICPPFHMRAIVGGKDDQGIFGDPQL